MSPTAAALWTGRIFPGLRPFDESDALLFFGRERQVDELLRRVEDTRFLAVVGLSGCGKSSLIRAGLLPALRRGHLAEAGSRWHIALMRPGSDPLGALARALDGALGSRPDRREILGSSSLGLIDASRLGRKPEENLLIVVDQFEELFRFQREYRQRGEEAAAFVQLLISAAQEFEPEFRLYIVLTMRSDYLGECARFPGLPEMLNESQYLVPAMTRDQLREAIQGPAALGGVELDPELLEMLLNRTACEMDQLPVLQHLLMRMWEVREQTDHNFRIRSNQYDAAGGWDGALDQHAEQVLCEAGAAREPLVKRIFQRLTEKGPVNRESRRPATLRELAAVAAGVPENQVQSVEDIVAVLKPFQAEGCNFLTSPDAELTADSLVDISHESLIRRWTKLRAWADEEADSAEWYRRVETSKRLQDRGQGGWFSDPLQLAAALRAKEACAWNPCWAGRYTTEAGGERLPYQEVVNYLEDSRKKDEFRRLRKSRKIAAVVALALAAFAAFAVYNWVDARGARQEALSALLAMYAEAVHGSQPDPTLSALLAAESLRVRQTAQGYSALWRANELMRPAIARLPHREPATCVAFDPAGLLAAGSRDGAIRLWNGSSLVDLVRLPSARINAVAFSPDGTLLAAGADDGIGHLWEVRTGAEVRQWKRSTPYSAGLPPWITSVAFSPDGQLLAIGSSDHMAQIWRIRTGQEVRRLPHGGWVYAVAFSPDGQLLATASGDGSAHLWAVRTGREFLILPHGSPVHALAFSGDTRLATGTFDGIARVWDARTGRELVRLFSDSAINSVSFSPDGSMLASGSWDNVARVWDIKSEKLLASLSQESFVNSVAFSPDGERLAAASDFSVLVWGLSPPRLDRRPHSESGTALASSANGALSATAASDGTVRIWETQTGRDLAYLPHQDAVTQLLFNPTGTLLAVACKRGQAFVWDVHGQKLAAIASPGAILSMAFSADGALLATASDDKTARVWDARTGRPITSLEHDASVTTVAFNPDATVVATGSSTGTIRIWSAASGREQARIPLKDPVSAVAFSPDGRLLAAGSLKENAWVWEFPRLRNLASLDLENGVLSLAFSGDSKLLAIASSDFTAHIWEAKTGREVAEVPVGRPLIHVGFVEDRHLLLETVTSQDNLLVRRTDPLDGRDLIREACSKLGRNLTAAEWLQFAGGHSRPPETCTRSQLNQTIAREH